MIPRCSVVLLLSASLITAAHAQAPESPGDAADRPAQASPDAAAAPEVKLAEQRWREAAFGLSLLPPADARIVENTAEGDLASFTVPGGTVMTVAIRQNMEAALDLKTLKQQTRVEVSYGSRQALEIDTVPLRPAGRPGSLTYFDIERNPNLFDKRHGDHWILGLAMMKIDPHTVAVLQLRTSIADYPRARAIFEAMLHSIELAPPGELDRIRTAWISAGQRWYEGVTREALVAAMTVDQWYRVLEGDQDVGYMRIRHALGETFDLPGLRVEVQSRIISGGASFDTESFFFVSDDRTTEVWSVRTAQRNLARQQHLPGNAPGPAPQMYEETGLRSGESITVKRSLPGNVEDLAWEMPPTGYLSQAELHLLPALLPRDQQRDLAFYAYNSATAELALRKFSIFPLDDGRYLVRDRPTPEQGEQVSTYSATGQLQRREMSDGRVYIPATPEEMKRIWDVR